MSRRLLSAIVCVGLLVLLGLVVLPALAPASNCGGNSYAKMACKQILIYEEWARGTNSSTFDLAKLEAVDRTNLFQVVTRHWTSGAGYWLRTNGFGNRTSKEVVVVCDTVYDNVPQPAVWNLYHRNPAHAVGYSDGTTGLIPPSEFKALDRRAFISLSTLATNISK